MEAFYIMPSMIGEKFVPRHELAQRSPLHGDAIDIEDIMIGMEIISYWHGPNGDSIVLDGKVISISEESTLGSNIMLIEVERTGSSVNRPLESWHMAMLGLVPSVDRPVESWHMAALGLVPYENKITGVYKWSDVVYTLMAN